MNIIKMIFDWVMDIYDKFHKQEEVHPFLQDDDRPLQLRGRPRKD